MQDKINTIIQGDCLKEVDKIPDNFIDLIVTDPPYGDNAGYGRMKKEIQNNEDESINYDILPKLYNKLKDNGTCYLFTNWKFYPSLHLFISENTPFTIRTMIVIVKNNIGMGYGFRNQHELCFVLEKGKPEYNGCDFSNVQKMQHIQHDKDTHPHEKGLDLLKKMILHSSTEGDIILDCFAGSGSTLVAAKQEGRNYVGIELEERYCTIARDRLKQETLF